MKSIHDFQWITNALMDPDKWVNLSTTFFDYVLKKEFESKLNKATNGDLIYYWYVDDQLVDQDQITIYHNNSKGIDELLLLAKLQGYFLEIKTGLNQGDHDGPPHDLHLTMIKHYGYVK